MNNNKIIIVHHNDLDGHCAGALIYRHLLDNEVRMDKITLIEADYTKIDLDEDIAKDAIIYFLDYSFTESTFETLKKYINLSHKVIWIDHHISSLKLIMDEKYRDWFRREENSDGKLESIIDINHCGAYLTWEYISPRNEGRIQVFEDVPFYIELIDIYDRWQSDHKLFTKATEFKKGMDARNTDPTSSIWNILAKYRKDKIRDIIANGKMIMKYTKINNKRRFDDFGYFTHFFNSRIPVINSDGNSTLFGELINEYACVVRYHYKNGVYTYSIYSKFENVDCSIMAAVYGGGGHKGAAGFQTKRLILPYKENLFTKLRNRWEVRKYYKLKMKGNK